MSFSQIQELVLVKSSNLWELTAAKVTSIDSSTQHLIVIVGAIFTLVAICLGLASIFQKKEVEAAAPEGTDVVSGSITILLRDLSTKITNHSTQSREDFAFLKQEILEIRSAMSSASQLQSAATELLDMRRCVGHLPELEQHIDTLNSRIASYANLMREEFDTLREEILNGKLAGKKTSHVIGSHVVDSAEFFKQ